MTKSQNTKNEQNCIKQNEKIFIQNDLSLTELWQKGELPSGFYYIKRGLSKRIDISYLGGALFEGNIEVIELVPTFDEWQASEKYNKHLEEKIKIYERKDKQATETSIAYNELLEEKAQLKELLKECIPYIALYTENNKHIGFTPETANLLQRIKEVLK